MATNELIDPRYGRLAEFADISVLTPVEVQDADGDCGCDGDGETVALIGEVQSLTASAPGVVADDAPDSLDVRWEGVLCVEGTPTGDGRMMAPGSLTWDALPMPIRYVESDVGGHDNATVVGKIETVERRDDGVIWGTGTLSPETPEGPTAIGKLTRKEQTGVSVDLDSVSFEVRVAQSIIDQFDSPEEEAALDTKADSDGRVKIGEYKADDELTLVTNARIRTATIVAVPAFAEARISVVETLAPALTASAFSDVPKAEFFENPHLTEPTPLTVEGNRVYGHLATWDACHIGFAQCTTAPHSETDYRYFHLASLDTDAGPLPVGKLTVDTGHAKTDLTASPAAAHYDDTGAVAAFVRAGEDSHGIWIAGVLSPDATEKQIRSLRTSPLSGDWRRIGGNYELVAALAVNVPGFPIPRPSGFVAGGEMVSLVAAGMVPPARVVPKGREGALSDEDLRYLKRLARLGQQKEREMGAKALAAQVKMAEATMTANMHKGGE